MELVYGIGLGILYLVAIWVCYYKIDHKEYECEWKKMYEKDNLND